MGFDSLPYEGLKDLFNDAISSMFSTDGLKVSCKLMFSSTKFNDCTNCIYDNIGRKSSNRFQSGGSIPFPFGQICPVCNGAGKISNESSETVDLLVVYDPKQFIGGIPVNVLDGSIQVIAKKALTSKLEKTNYLLTSLPANGFKELKYKRNSAVVPAGFGSEQFVFCNWDRV